MGCGWGGGVGGTYICTVSERGSQYVGDQGYGGVDDDLLVAGIRSCTVVD